MITIQDLIDLGFKVDQQGEDFQAVQVMDGDIVMNASGRGDEVGDIWIDVSHFNKFELLYLIKSIKV